MGGRSCVARSLTKESEKKGASCRLLDDWNAVPAEMLKVCAGANKKKQAQLCMSCFRRSPDPNGRREDAFWVGSPSALTDEEPKLN